MGMDREHVSLTFGGAEYTLRPTFRVVSEFEAKFGALPLHLMALANAAATLRNRAYLIYLGMKADRDATGERGRGELTWDSVAQAMFEAGLADDDIARAEIEFVEKLLYAPEKYLEKKAERAAAMEQMQTALRGFPNSSESPPPP